MVEYIVFKGTSSNTQWVGKLEGEYLKSTGWMRLSTKQWVDTNPTWMFKAKFNGAEVRLLETASNQAFKINYRAKTWKEIKIFILQDSL